MKTILDAFMVLVGLIFPLIIAGRAWRRGHREWGAGTGLAVSFSWIMGIILFPEAGSIWGSIIGILLIFIPPIVAIVAYRKSMKPVAPPEECPEPECDGYGAAKGRVTLDQETGKEVSTKFTGIILLISGLGFCLWMIIGALTWDTPAAFPGGQMIIPFLFGCLMVATGFKTVTQRPAKIVEKMMYRCRVCKHNWTQ